MNAKVMQSARAQAIMLVGPAFAVYATFAIWPMIEVVVLSFQHWNGLDRSGNGSGSRIIATS